MITKLEEIILSATYESQKRYYEISNGGWLSYGHESFMHCKIAEAIYDRHNKYVDIDTSIKKMVEYIDDKYKERIMDKRRFDVWVWKKQSRECEAIIEVKRIYNNFDGVIADAEKIETFFKKYKKQSPNKGYLLVYCEANANEKEKCEQKIAKKLDKLDSQLEGWKRIGNVADAPEKFDERWSGWQAILFRMDNPHK